MEDCWWLNDQEWAGSPVQEGATEPCLFLLGQSHCEFHPHLCTTLPDTLSPLHAKSHIWSENSSEQPNTSWKVSASTGSGSESMCSSQYWPIKYKVKSWSPACGTHLYPEARLHSEIFSENNQKQITKRQQNQETLCLRRTKTYLLYMWQHTGSQLSRWQLLRVRAQNNFLKHRIHGDTCL